MSRKRRKRKRLPAGEREAGISIDAPDAPAEGEDAGPDDDLRRARTYAQVSEARAAANLHFTTAKRLAGHSGKEAESEARQAIRAIVRAFWRAEDTDLEDDQHELMHEIGRWTREHFGCHLHVDGQSYEQRCPIAIAHKRMGFSPGFTSKRICSICGDDLSECPHIRGRTYWVRGGPAPTGSCPVCMNQQCRHRPNRLYRVAVVSIITDVQAREVSIVDRPAQPEARLLALPVSTERLARTLGPRFQPGMQVSCDKCLEACPGIEEVFDR